LWIFSSGDAAGGIICDNAEAGDSLAFQAMHQLCGLRVSQARRFTAALAQYGPTLLIEFAHQDSLSGII
jgi:hypothetical protein